MIKIRGKRKMETTLKLPKSFVEIDQTEMTYLEGGVIALTVPTVIKMIVSAGGIMYGSAYAVGTRVGWMDSKKGVNKWYNSIKWPLRGGLITVNPFLGGIALIGFENGLYSTLNNRK